MINHKDNCEHEISGSEGKAARAKCRELTDAQRRVRTKVNAILDRHLGDMFIEFDELHTHFAFADEDIIAVLKADGWDEEADAYQEMIAEKDPSRDYRDPTPQGEELVTDPMDSDSNRLMEKTLGVTYEFTQIETVRYTCRVTVNRAQMLAWLEKERPGEGDTPEDIDANDLTYYLTDNPGHTIEVSNREVDPSPDYVDLTVVDK